jgi:hypothetical protein
MAITSQNKQLSHAPLHHHLLRPSRLGEIIFGDLGIENGELKMENY